MAKVGFVKGAEEKYKLLTNGIKGSIDGFLKELSDGKINKSELNIFAEQKSTGQVIYYKECEKINVILTHLKDDLWIILDFLTPQEFKEIVR